MHRPLLIVAAFLLVTGGLIFFQPKQNPAERSAAIPTAVEPSAPVQNDAVVTQYAERVSELTPYPPVTANQATEAAESQSAPAVEVTRAAPITLTNRPAEDIGTTTVERDEMLFGRLAEDRPNLLTATRRAPDGTLRPSLLQMGTEPIATQPATRAAPTVAAVTAPVSNAPTEPAAAPVGTTPALTAEPAQTLENFAANTDTSDLRAALAAAPTQAVHTVRLGDSLTTLALRYYNDPSKADLIFEANRRVLTSRTLTVGQLLRIPELTNL